ncbi:hypothetical protein [Nonomuraea sp. SYSU D8015]|uniref:hypothetical protein n=1 Tax=Nonomuraea sp. SYSU D8015 TaxID=2593644 RepID=UPI0016601806|nr:hypothetical protein [Nonomuraea sp. SYSU D8015]
MRFSKPLVVALTSAAMLALPLSGAALADVRKPQPTTAIETPKATPTYDASTLAIAQELRDSHSSKAGLKVSVEPSRVRAGASYEVTINAKGVSSRTATVISPEGKTYRVALSGGSATKTLTVPANAKPGAKTVTVKVGNKVATASFTVVGGKKQDERDDHGHDGH